MGNRKSNPKYVNPTGPGYLGTYTDTGRSVSVPIGAWEDITWTSDDQLWAVLEELNRSKVVAIVDEEPSDSLCEANVQEKGKGTQVIVTTKMLDSMYPTCGNEIRLYRRAAGGIYVVPRQNDPTLELPSGHPQLQEP